MYSAGGVMELFRLRDKRMLQHLLGCSLKCFSDSMNAEIAVMSA